MLSGSFRIVRIVFRIFKRRISYSVESVVYFVWIQGGNFFRCCQDRSGSRRIARGSECAVKGGDRGFAGRISRGSPGVVGIVQHPSGSFRIAEDHSGSLRILNLTPYR